MNLPSEAEISDLEATLQPGYISPAQRHSDELHSGASGVPAHSLSDDSISSGAAESLLRSRRMDATRSLVHAARVDIARIFTFHETGHPDIFGAIRDLLALVKAAEHEIDAAERGCGAEDGECTCPCHAGIRRP